MKEPAKNTVKRRGAEIREAGLRVRDALLKLLESARDLENVERRVRMPELEYDRRLFVTAVSETDQRTLCADCVDELQIDMEPEECQVWEEYSNGWISAPICAECKTSIPVVVDGEEVSD